MTRPLPRGHPRGVGRIVAILGARPELPIQGGGTRPMLTISIIFALLVLLWGRVGVAHVDR